MYAAPIGTKDSSEAELLAIYKVLQLSAAEDSMFWASKFLSNQIHKWDLLDQKQGQETLESGGNIGYKF